eukprot:Gb_30960 [translate_table: standard]
MFAEHLGELELAGASISNVGIQGLAYGIMCSADSMLASLWCQTVQCPWCNLPKVHYNNDCNCHTSLYWFADSVLIEIGQSKAIAAAGATFARGLIPQLFAFALNCPMQRFLQAQNIVAPLAYISVGTVLLHILLTWLAVDKLGFGLLGAALTLSLSWWILVIGNMVHPRTSPHIRIAARCISCFGLVRVGNELRACRPKSARFSVKARCPPASSSVSSCYWSSGVAIGCGWQSVVAYVNLATYYIIGLPIRIVLGFKTCPGHGIIGTKRIKRLESGFLFTSSLLSQKHRLNQGRSSPVNFNLWRSDISDRNVENTYLNLIHIDKFFGSGTEEVSRVRSGMYGRTEHTDRERGAGSKGEDGKHEAKGGDAEHPGREQGAKRRAEERKGACAGEGNARRRSGTHGQRAEGRQCRMGEGDVACSNWLPQAMY